MNSRRIYLEVPFVENEAAKHLGARWDKIAKAWYVPVGQDPVPFLKRWPRISTDPALDRPVEPLSSNYSPERKLLAAQVLGRLGGIAGGKKGGKARAEALSPERRKEIAQMGVQARNKKRASERAMKILQARERRETLLNSSPIRQTRPIADERLRDDRPESEVADNRSVMTDDFETNLDASDLGPDWDDLFVPRRSDE